MELKIKKVFRDKNTAVLYNINDVIDFEPARAEELLADRRQLVEKVEEDKKTKSKRTKK